MDQEKTHLEFLINKRDEMYDAVHKVHPRKGPIVCQMLTEIRSLNDQILKLTMVENALGKNHGEPNIKTPLFVDSVQMAVSSYEGSRA